MGTPALQRAADERFFHLLMVLRFSSQRLLHTSESAVTQERGGATCWLFAIKGMINMQEILFDEKQNKK